MYEALVENENDCLENLIDIVTRNPLECDSMYSQEATRAAEKLLNKVITNKQIAEVANEKGLVSKLSSFWENFSKTAQPEELKHYTKKLKTACSTKEGTEELLQTKIFSDQIQTIKTLEIENITAKECWELLLPALDLI